MSTRSSHNWQTQPGYANSLHLDTRYPAADGWGIPQLAAASAQKLPKTLIAYGYRARPQEPFVSPCTHFFLDDYRFEIVWRKPRQGLQSVSKYPFVLTPDFSLYRDWPLAAQLWNVYRNRYCGAYWQRHGLSVIPTVSWSSAESYPFCFSGIARGSVVAISAVGVRWHYDLLAHALFMQGFQAMLECIDPAVVIAYGNLPPACGELVETLYYPTRWEKGRRQKAEG